jgi:hypothetical protein
VPSGRVEIDQYVRRAHRRVDVRAHENTGRAAEALAGVAAGRGAAHDVDRRSERALSIGKHGLDQRLTIFPAAPATAMRTGAVNADGPAALIS